MLEVLQVLLMMRIEEDGLDSSCPVKIVIDEVRGLFNLTEGAELQVISCAATLGTVISCSVKESSWAAGGANNCEMFSELRERGGT